eukprot:5774327-Pleurochrysis_carterae.AAC.1
MDKKVQATTTGKKVGARNRWISNGNTVKSEEVNEKQTRRCNGLEGSRAFEYWVGERVKRTTRGDVEAKE